MFKLYQVVDGALLQVRVQSPGTLVRATARVTTNQRRAFMWSAAAVSDASGVATIRVPYSAGQNGLTVAEPYVVSSGARTVVVPVPEQDVLGGSAVPVDLTRTGAGGPG